MIHGKNGVSQKAEGAGKASHYISFTRLATTGAIVLDGKRFSVEGASWMDHEFFSHQLEANQSGWDWFSLQLEDRSELMLFRLRRTGGAHRSLFGRNLHRFARSRQASCRRRFYADTGKNLDQRGNRRTLSVEWTIEVPSIGFKAAVRTPLVSRKSPAVRTIGKARSISTQQG